MTLAWHFVGPKLRDGRDIPADGMVLRHTGELVACQSGLHASENILDALGYAPGATLCRVRLGGEIINDRDKLVATERTILWRIDATDLLREFARWCALQVVHLWGAPDVVRQYLETGDETIRDAARVAAWATSRTAARAAWAATRYAAWEAARYAAWAAWAAVRDIDWTNWAAWNAGTAWAAQATRLLELVEAEAKKRGHEMHPGEPR